MEPVESHVLSWSEFRNVDIRVGRVTKCEASEKTRNPAYKLWIDFGALGQRKSSAQLTALYSPQDVVGRLVLAVVNFPDKQIADFMSQVLVLGLVGEGGVVLVGPDRDVPLGLRLA